MDARSAHTFVQSLESKCSASMAYLVPIIIIHSFISFLVLNFYGLRAPRARHFLLWHLCFCFAINLVLSV